MEWVLERSAHPQAVREADGDALAAFAAGIAHDFNNLLTVVNGYGELALCAEREPAILRQYVGEILRAGYRAAEIVDLVLSFSGRQMIHSEPFEVNGMLREMRSFLPLYLGESISLDMRICDAACCVRGDKGQLQWVLVNLVMNAKEAMAEGGRVVISTRQLDAGTVDAEGEWVERASVEIAVADTGCGIPAENLGRVFEPYFTTKKASNRNGLGMGLACAQGIARRFGGTIRAASVPGKGSCFRVRLPLAEAA
jgi:signal transduction histidine kinase